MLRISRLSLSSVTLCVLPLVASAAIPTDLSPGSELGLVRVQCTSDQDLRMLFRGALIETGNGQVTHEVVLTAAHGLPHDLEALRTACVVLDDTGRRYRLSDAWRPSLPTRGMADDWAVLTTERRLRGSHARFFVEAPRTAVRQQLEARSTALRLPLLTVAEERACTLEAYGLSWRERARGLFAHSCRSWQGHSGSPILVAIDGSVVLIGLHLASRWFYEGQRVVKVGRYVDEEIVTAIRAAAGTGVEAEPRVAWRRGH